MAVKTRMSVNSVAQSVSWITSCHVTSVLLQSDTDGIPRPRKLSHDAITSFSRDSNCGAWVSVTVMSCSAMVVFPHRSVADQVLCTISVHPFISLNSLLVTNMFCMQLSLAVTTAH